MTATSPQEREVLVADELLQAALGYAASGLQVLPIWGICGDGACSCGKGPACDAPGKHPIPAQGLKAATTERTRIEAWWREHPDANVGVRTGEVSGLTVIDIDGPEGYATFARLVGDNPEPTTPTAATGSGSGSHLFFHYNAALTTKANALGPGVDCRNDGGYVVMAPSRHSSGGKYEWLLGLDTPLAHLPKFLTRPPKRTRRQVAVTWPLPAVVEMLQSIDADDRDLWLKVGIILGREFERSDDAWEVYEAWAKTSAKYADAGTHSRMRECFYKQSQQALGDGESLSMGSLVHWATEGGWTAPNASLRLDDFYAYSPSHTYIHRPTREMWPAVSVNSRIRPWPSQDGRTVSPSAHLDRHRAVEQMTWNPGEPELIRDRVVQSAGWVDHPGAAVFNQYVPPKALNGDATQADAWLRHLRRLYPDDADHIARYLAHRIQRPGEKVNHALVLIGAPGIGKDSLLVPARSGVGEWNCQDISPAQLLGRFNGFAKCVLLVISEARDLGDVDRFKFYDHSKVYLASPPDVIRIDEKNAREHYAANVCGVVITTNHRGDGLYLPPDDRRHYVADSPVTAEDFPSGYFAELHRWFRDGGVGHVVAFLRSLDLACFDPKAPPPKTPAFWSIAQAGEAPESSELRDAVEALGTPKALTIRDLVRGATKAGHAGLASDLQDRGSRRRIRHWLETVGYGYVKNPDTKEGRWKVSERNEAIYALSRLPLSDQILAARAVCDGGKTF